MNMRAETHHLVQLSNQHLDALEEETIFILREVAATFDWLYAICLHWWKTEDANFCVKVCLDVLREEARDERTL